MRASVRRSKYASALYPQNATFKVVFQNAA